eukprot:2144239-Amphidinium_carterae.1
MKISSLEDKDNCRRRLMMWCLEAPLHATKHDHGNVNPRWREPLPEETLQQRVDALALPGIVRTDEELAATTLDGGLCNAMIHVHIMKATTFGVDI